MSEVLEENYLHTDSVIQEKWNRFDDADDDCVVDNDYIISAGGIGLIYHSQYLGQFGPIECGTEKYFYDVHSATVTRDDDAFLTNFLDRGDVFVQYMVDPEGDYNHYGLVIDGNTILDSNWANPLDGRIHKGMGTRNPDHWKVMRPQ